MMAERRAFGRHGHNAPVPCPAQGTDLPQEPLQRTEHRQGGVLQKDLPGEGGG